MAEIKDVYSLEFNSGSFQAEVESAISKVEELNSAMESGADVADDLAAAQNELVSVLGKEAKGVEQLNQKRNVLVNTQKKLNTESKTGVVVSNQLATTNNQLAVATGTAAKQQRGLVGSLITGTRAISQMRRVASTLTFVFRGLMSALPFGIIMAAAGPVLDFFSRWWSGVDKTAENMEKLNDKTLSYSERLEIAQTELERLNSIETKRGYLTEKEKQQRDELTKKYQETADEIVKIETDRYFEIADLETKAARIRLKLRGDSVETVKEGLEIERKALIDSYKRRKDDLTKQIDELYKKEISERAKGNYALADELYKEWSNLESIRLNLLKAQTAEIENLEFESQQKINKIYQDAQKERERKEKEALNAKRELEDRMFEEWKSQKEQEEMIEEAGNKVLQERLKLRQEELEAIRQLMKEQQNQLSEFENQLKASTQYQEDNKEAQLAISLLQLEQERNERLLYINQTVIDEKERNKLLEEVNDGFNKRRAEMERATNLEILRLRIDLLKRLRDETAAADPAALAEYNKQIAQLELQFTELSKPVNNVGGELTDINGKLKDAIKTATEFIQIASDNVFSVLNAQTQAYISALDRAAEKSRETLNDIRQNSENFNARQLELEKERLEKLQAEREKAVEREKTIAQIQVALNAAVTVAKAAAEGGGIASAVTIAAALASLIAGFASARAAAGNAFYHGVEYLERGNNPVGRDTIPARLHEGERVITAADNAAYWDALTGIHNHRIPADILNGFVNGYQKNGLKGAFDMFSDRINISRELGGQAVFVNVGNNNSGLENRLERIEQVLTELPKYMPRTTVNANANGIFKIVEQRMNRAKFSRDRAK